MQSEQQQRIMGYFIEEAKDHLNTIEQGLLSLQATISDPDMAHEVFRAAHSVKGGAAMLGLESIQHTAHRLEDYFKVLKECPVQVDQRLETLLLNVFDTLKELLDQLQGPFGLTDDKSAEAIRSLEPVFTDLNSHISQLVEHAGAKPPEDVDLEAVPAAPETPAAATATPASAAADTTEESAFQVIFQSDVPVRLREMLDLFRQPELSDTRQQLQDVCQSLMQAGEQFELVPWVDLLELARRAIAHEDNDFRSLAPVIIREVKQAQELVLSGQPMAIAASDSLLSLVPPETDPDLEELESLDFLADDDTEMGSLDLIETDDLLSTSLDLDDDAQMEAADSGMFDFDSLDLPDTDDLGTADLDLGTPAATPEDDDGPAVGAAELSSLADLFEEEEAPDLSINWQNEEVLLDSDESLPEPLETDLPGDFSDLLQDGLDDLLAPPSSDDSDDSLSDLIRRTEQSEPADESAIDSFLDIGSAPEDVETPTDDSESSPDMGSDLDLSDLGLDLDPDAAIAQPASSSGDQDEKLIGDLGIFFSDVPEETLDADASNSSEDEAADLNFLLETNNDTEADVDLGLDLDIDNLTNEGEETSDNWLNLDSPDETPDAPTPPEPQSDSLDFDLGLFDDAANAAEADDLDFNLEADDEPFSLNLSESDTPDEEPQATPSDDATPMSWLEALDSEDGVEHLPAAPARWDGADQDVTADLWAEGEAAGVMAANPPATEAEEDIEPFDLSPDADEGAGSSDDETDFDLDLELETPADLAADSLAELDFDLDLDNVDLDSVATEADVATPSDTSEQPMNADVDADLDFGFLNTEPSTVMTDADWSGASPSAAQGDEAETPDMDDLNALLSEDADADSEADLSALLGSADNEVGDLDSLLSLDMTEAPEADAIASDSNMLDMADNLDLDMSASLSDATESVGDDLDLDLDALMDESEAEGAIAPDLDSADSDDMGDLDLDALMDESEAEGAIAPNLDSSDSDDLSDLDALLDQSEPAVTAPELTTDAATGDDFGDDDDFGDLDALLDQDSASTTEPEPNLPDTPSTDTADDFADLDALLGSETGAAPSPASPPNPPAGDDFADLDALLGAEATPAPATPAASGETPNDGGSSDEFDELEKLLEAADSALGGSPTVRGVRSPAIANRRPTRTSGLRSDQTMRVSVKNLDNLNNLIGELVVNRNSLEQAEERLRQFLDNLQYQVQQLSDVGQRMRDLYERSLLESSLMSNRKTYQMAQSGGAAQGGAASSHATGVNFDALEMDRFTGFHTLSQEMIELIVRVRESASDIDFVVGETDQITRNFRQITSQLQESLTRARMVPFAQTADRLPRAVRDISLRCGKQAELSIEGRETLIDKMILEQLYDPMTHLVNNAITHGIETPDERVAHGKAATGRITVRAFHQGNQTVISVSDDGAGIDPDQVKQKAMDRGLITSEQASAMNRLDVYDLLFHHGFSTRDRADDFAGRGVGMDVVRTSLNDIRGVINIDSNIGRGTTFTIRLPLTLSVSKALCCISNRARIAFPMDGVEDMLDVPRDQIKTNETGEACIQWRDQLLPFQSLSELLKFNRSLGRGSVYGGNQEDDIISVVVLRSNAGSYLALQVDQVLGEQEIVIKQLEGPVPKPVGIAGATVQGDGRIMPIADVLELIDLSQGRIRREAGSSLWEKAPDQPPAQAEPDVKTDPTVLIVDDSITVRELLSMTFSKVGYRVEQARDGQEAWEKLRSGLPCDLVFCDIEMPRMDGLELLSRLQKDNHLNQIPIAMLTSRGADRHRQMAITLGAKGYFTKPYLEEVLLDAAQRMLTGEVLIDGSEPADDGK